MQKNADGTITLTKAEVQSLKKVIESCNEAISQLPNDGDFLGWDNYRALQMWEDKLKGQKHELNWYIDAEYEESDHNGTVDTWLEDYGKAR